MRSRASWLVSLKLLGLNARFDGPSCTQTQCGRLGTIQWPDPEHIPHSVLWHFSHPLFRVCL